MAGEIYGTTGAQLEATATKLDAVVSLLRAMLEQPAAVRELQSRNSERATLFLQATIEDDDVFFLRDLIGALRAETFSLLLVTLTSTSGGGFWLAHGERPTAAGYGVPVQSGESFTVRGQQNIDAFSMIASTGETVQASFYLFK